MTSPEQDARDPLAVLEEIRERNAARVVRASDVERLLAIPDALLKLAGDLDQEAVKALEPTDEPWTAEAHNLKAAWATACNKAADGIRTAIAAAPTGEETPAS